jgi:hypothetical protein
MEGGGAGYIQGSRVPREASVGSREASVGSREASVGSREASVGSREASLGSSRQQGWCCHGTNSVFGQSHAPIPTIPPPYGTVKDRQQRDSIISVNEIESNVMKSFPDC